MGRFVHPPPAGLSVFLPAAEQRKEAIFHGRYAAPFQPSAPGPVFSPCRPVCGILLSSCRSSPHVFVRVRPSFPFRRLPRRCLLSPPPQQRVTSFPSPKSWRKRKAETPKWDFSQVSAMTGAKGAPRKTISRRPTGTNGAPRGETPWPGPCWPTITTPDTAGGWTEGEPSSSGETPFPDWCWNTGKETSTLPSSSTSFTTGTGTGGIPGGTPPVIPFPRGGITPTTCGGLHSRPGTDITTTGELLPGTGGALPYIRAILPSTTARRRAAQAIRRSTGLPRKARAVRGRISRRHRRPSTDLRRNTERRNSPG